MVLKLSSTVVPFSFSAASIMAPSRTHGTTGRAAPLEAGGGRPVGGGRRHVGHVLGALEHTLGVAADHLQEARAPKKVAEVYGKNGRYIDMTNI